MDMYGIHFLMVESCETQMKVQLFVVFVYDEFGHVSRCIYGMDKSSRSQFALDFDGKCVRIIIQRQKDMIIL